MSYRIEYSPEVQDHMRVLTSRQQGTVIDSVDKQLSFQPTVETRNRKLLKPNPLAPWELRVGNIRIFYDVKEKPEQLVLVRAVGIKERNVVRIGKEVFIL